MNQDELLVKMNNEMCEQIVTEGFNYIKNISNKWFHKFNVEIDNGKTYIDQFRFCWEGPNYDFGTIGYKYFEDFIARNIDNLRFVRFEFKFKATRTGRKSSQYMNYYFDLFPVAKNQIGFTVGMYNIGNWPNPKKRRGLHKSSKEAIEQCIKNFYEDVKEIL